MSAAPPAPLRAAAPAGVAEPAPAKINLYLHVTGRRPDGYHELDSLAVFAAAADRVSARPAPALSLEIAGPFGPGLAAEPDNLVLRAARALAAETGAMPGAALQLEKNLPVASGIGGGSADAAAALRLLARLWQVRAAPPTLHAIASRLGADVPVCLAAAPCRMGGIGEILSPPPALPRFGLVLVNPGVAVATAAVFRARAPGLRPPATLPARWPDAAAMAADLRRLANDLQPAALALCPAIGEALAALGAAPGVLFAAMSGSGATCFGLTADPETAARAATRLGRPGWWVWGGAPFAPGPIAP